MRLIFLGPPGAGKGTQSQKLSEKLSIPHISTGDIFRKNLKEKTPLGMKAKEYMDKGLLVPDKVVVEIVEDRLKENDCDKGFILDGFPRTDNQAKALDQALSQMKTKLDYAVKINVSRNELISRLTGRRVCKDCGDTYHMKYDPPKTENNCNKCGGELMQRDDDKEQTVINRLEVYKKETQPLINYYDKKGLLVTINGEQPMEKVLSDILESIGSFK